MMTTRFKYRLLCLLGVVFLFASIAPGSDTTAFYKPLKIQQPPRIDGKLDEPCWDQAMKVTRFFKVGDEKPPVAAEVQSTVSLCYDAENIYLGMVCFEPEMKEIRKDFTDRDDPIWSDDCVEIFISPDYTDLSSYYHLLVNPAGTQTDQERNSLRGSNWGWNGKWVASVRRLKDRWIVELRIPFLDLGIEDSASVNLLGISICRARKAGKAENTAWQIGGSFHWPNGQVVLTSFERFIEKDLLPSWQREKAAIFARLEDNDVMSGGYRKALEAVVKYVDREIALGQKRPTGQSIRTMAKSIKKAQNTGPFQLVGNIDKVDFNEPSGICWHSQRKTLFVVGDEGDVCEIRTDGTLIKQKRIRPADFEGITHDPSTGLLYIAVEGKESIIEIDAETFEVRREFSIPRSFGGKTLMQAAGNGIEAITFVPDPAHPEGGTFYVANQALGFTNEHDISAVFHVELPLRSNIGNPKILGYFTPAVIDLSGLYYDPTSDHIFVISDETNTVMEYSRQHILVRTYPFPGRNQEGITADNDGFIYIAQDSGGIIKLKWLRGD